MLFITNQVILLFFYEEGTIERGVSKYGQRGGRTVYTAYWGR